jgi:peroxiredoxin
MKPLVHSKQSWLAAILFVAFLLPVSVKGLQDSSATKAPSGKPPRVANVVVKDFTLKDSQKQVRTRAEWKGQKAVALFFLGTECPVSNGYAPEFRRLARMFKDRGVLFYGVHPDPDVTAEAAAKHATEFRLDFPILLDPTHVLVKPTGVRVVPEAVVLSPHGALLYRGRIDDRYSPEGKRREEPQTRDLQLALEAILAGKKPPAERTTAFGCPLPAPAKSSSR